MEIEREVVGAPVMVSFPCGITCRLAKQKSSPQRTMSDNVNDPPPVLKPGVASQDVLVRKEEVRLTKESSDIHVTYIMTQVTHKFLHLKYPPRF